MKHQLETLNEINKDEIGKLSEKKFRIIIVKLVKNLENKRIN